MTRRRIAPALRRAEHGLTTIEYAVAGGLVTAAIVVAFIALGNNVLGIMTALNQLLTTGGGG